ncbi:diadenylate cyclase [Roseibacterium beibuensis]|uniref:diadenylate cyclase n=1 Tax=[Roseibacterium] beibuensis TaxID=1193142 RepID=UPI00217E58B1|nr:diadenylate cyclase [Roseibacterium beibuensis]MCS6626942.1 diadenylate cyclase [Roseibacterium beibuensis]
MKLIGATLGNCLESSALNGAVRLIADMSYERKGALFVFCDDQRSIGRMVPDHGKGDRTNKPVRNFARRLNMADVGHQTILRNVAAIDGAVVVGRDGHVLDAACMVATPSAADLTGAGFSSPKTFAGARTTAAWNASLYGTSVKVSEDGPISVFRAGKLILSIG